MGPLGGPAALELAQPGSPLGGWCLGLAGCGLGILPVLNKQPQHHEVRRQERALAAISM